LVEPAAEDILKEEAGDDGTDQPDEYRGAFGLVVVLKIAPILSHVRAKLGCGGANTSRQAEKNHAPGNGLGGMVASLDRGPGGAFLPLTYGK